MTASTHVVTPTLPLRSISPSQSLEDIHFNLAQEITRAMGSPISTTERAAIQLPPCSTPPPPPPAPKAVLPTARSSARTLSSNASSRSHCSRAPIVKPSPAEEELVRKIHRKVGGPSKLSTYDDPAKVRHVVIEALALEQLHVNEAERIRRGQLSVFERRVVRTVTNRGAAVRSRMRQRRQVAQLKHELRVREMRCRQLENVINTLCSKYALPMPYALSTCHARGSQHDSESESMHSTEKAVTSQLAHAVLQHQQQQQQQPEAQPPPPPPPPPLTPLPMEPELFGALIMEHMPHMMIPPHSAWV